MYTFTLRNGVNHLTPVVSRDIHRTRISGLTNSSVNVNACTGSFVLKDPSLLSWTVNAQSLQNFHKNSYKDKKLKRKQHKTKTDKFNKNIESI